MKQRDISKTTILTVFTGLLGQFVTIFSGIIIARTLGAEGRGYLALIILFPVIISTLGSLGLPYAVTYYLVKGKLNANLVRSLITRTIPSQIFLILVIHYFLLEWYLVDKEDIFYPAILTLLLAPLLLTQQYGMAFIQGLNKFNLFNLLRLIAPVLYTFLVLVLWLSDIADLFNILLMWIVANAISMFLITINVRNNLTHLKNIEVSEKGSEKDFYYFGIKGMFGAVSPLESFRLDHILAGLFLTPAMLGFYVVGQAFSNIPNFVSRSASMAAFPIISKKNKQAGMKLVWQYFGVISIINIFISLILIFLLPYILPWLFGSQFEESILLGQILLIGTTISASRRILVEGLRGIGLPHISTYVEFVMYPWILTGGIFLTVNYFNVGLAFAVATSYAISLVFAITFALMGQHGKKEAVS